MKTTTQTVQKSGFAIVVNESSGRYDFYNEKPAYALNDKIYDTEAEAKQAVKSYVLDQYSPECVDDDFDGSSFSYSNGADRDEEAYGIEINVVKIDHYVIETTTTIIISDICS